MHRADGARIPVLCHARNLAQPGFVKPRVRKDNTDRCIADEFVFLYLNALQCKQLGVEEGPAVIRQQACSLAARLIVVNVAQRIDCHNRTDLQRPHLHGIAADAGFHAVVHAQQLAHGCAGARAIVAITVVAGFRVHAGLIRHGSIRAGVGIRHGQIKQI